MFRLFLIAIILVSIEKIEIVEVLVELFHSALYDIYSRYQYGFIRAYMFLVIPLFLAGMIDWNLVYRMFFPKSNGSFDWNIFIVLNWICSTVIVLAFTHLLTYADNNIINMKSIFIRGHFSVNTENRLALISALLSMTYLIGFFGVSLVMNDLRQTTQNIKLVSFVPPAYYLGIACFAWQLDSSLLNRMCIAVACTFFFAAISLSYRVKESVSNKKYKQELVAETERQNLIPEINNRASNYYTIYKLEDMMSKYQNEFIQDFFMYIIPLSLYGYFVPSTRSLLIVLSTVLATILPVFDLVATRIYLKPSTREDPSTPTATVRLNSYPYGGKVYANGWYHALDSSELAVGQSVHVSMNGIDYVIWRGADGAVRCLDAHCPHLGSNLSVEGKVVDNCIECPFHKWRFNGEGICTHIPYQDSIPAQAKTQAYYVCEYYGMVLVWFHSRHEKPSYYPPRIDLLDENRMVKRGSKTTIVNMHLNEFAENTTDFAHFGLLHGKMTVPFTLLEVPGIKITHRPGWREGEGDESHMCWFSDSADLNFYGLDIPHTSASAVITVIGPASVVFFTFETPIGNVIVFQTHTPIEPMRMHVRFRYYASSTMPRLLVHYIAGTWLSQWRNDVSIWENKKFLSRPLLIKNDGPMQKQRRWYRQFYTPPSAELQHDNSSSSSCYGHATVMSAEERRVCISDDASMNSTATSLEMPRQKTNKTFSINIHESQECF